MQRFSNWDLALGSGSSRVLDMALLTVSSAKESVHAKSLIVDQISGKTFLNRSFKLQFFYQDIFPLNLSICVYQRFFNIFNSFPIFSYDYFRKHYAVLFGEMSKTCFTAFETIKFYSIKKNLFLYAFLSLGLSLSRLLRFYIFSLVPTKKPLTFVSYFRSILMSLSASNHQLPELSLFVVPALGVIHLWRPKKMTNTLTHSPSRIRSPTPPPVFHSSSRLSHPCLKMSNRSIVLKQNP